MGNIKRRPPTPGGRRSLRGASFGRAAVVSMLTAALVVGGSATAANAEVTFETQPTGTYSGLPLFDAVPAHLDEYLDTLVHYAGLEASVNWANGVRGDFTIPNGPNAGKVVPGASLFGEGAQGISTDFPAQIGMGQSWNADLLKEIGDVIGDEALYLDNYNSSISTFNPMISAALQDIRPNPLSGRLDESYAEDPLLAQELLDQASRGISGIDDPANTDNFWTKGMIDTKHFTSYAGQWFRRTGSNNVDARSLMEYWSQAPLKGIESGAIGAFMTSYGRTNGVPNAVSPLIQFAQDKSPWGMYTVPDNGAESRLQVPNAFSNGFDDKYSPTWEDAAALFAIADSGSIAVNNGAAQLRAGLIDRIQKGTLGVTEEDVYDLAKDQIAPLVRMGLFNERGSDGLPVDYPFLGDSAASPTPINATVAEHQGVGLQAAQESIVLLKNENLLPLSKNSSLAVAGPLSDARFRTTYSVAAPSIPNAGLTPTQGIDALSSGTIASATDGDVIRIKSVASGKYLTMGTEAAPTLSAAGTTADDAATFEQFAWGQNAYGYKSTTSGKWIQFASNAVTVNQTADFGTNATAQPYRIRPVDNGDGTISFVVGSYTESFVGGFETVYWTGGRYLTIDPTTGQVGVTAPLTNEANAATLRTDAAKFTVENVREAGSQTAAAAKDVAVVVVGAPTRNSSGEGADRSDLAMGTEQYKLVQNVADAYPGRTVVVVSSNYPVLMDQIQNNSKVAAIVQAPYGGEYGNLALAQVLFGDYAPTGRLTTTWYASNDALPKLDKYSIPQGEDVTKSLASIDPRITVDMTEGDPAAAKLTYQYTDADATYDFGYGLSYTPFSWDNFQVTRDGDTFTATAEVTNTGTLDSSDVVQVYAKKPDSTYGDAAPKHKLVAFDKVTVPAGTTKEVSVNFDADAIALWDVNSNELRVEPGTYTFELGKSSSDIVRSVNLDVAGSAFASADAVTAPLNVFDHSFKASKVFYSEASKKNTADGLRADNLVSGYYTVGSRDAGAWTAIHDVDLTEAQSIAMTLGSTRTDGSTVELRIDSPDGQKIAQFDINGTGASEYAIPATHDPAGNIPVRELAYNTVESDVAADVTGKHDLYVVFTGADVRAKDLQITQSPLDVSAVLSPAEPTATGWYTQAVDVALATTGGGGLGATIEYKLDSAEWATYTAGFQVATQGAHTLVYRAKTAGETTAEKTVTFKVDSVTPVSAATVDEQARTVTIRSADDTSGVERTEVNVANGGWVTYNGAVSVGAAQTTVQFRSVDKAGNVEIAASAVVPKAGVTLAKSLTAANIADSSVKFYDSNSITVRVTGGTATATGTIKVVAGAVQVGSGTLSNGRATISLDKALLVPGSYTLQVRYSGNAALEASTDTVKLTVAKASATVKAAFVDSTIKSSTTPKLKVTVTSKAPVTGTVTVKEGSKTLKSNVTVVNGKATISLPKLKKGTHTVTVTYNGSSNIGTAKSSTIKVKVS